MTLTSPDRTQMSMFFTNDSHDLRVYHVHIKDMGFSPTSLSTVITKGPIGSRQAYDANWFQKGKNIKPSRKEKDVFVIKAQPHSILTVTTMDTSWVNGVNTFPAVQPPISSRLELPYHDDLQYTKDEIKVRGCAPRYMTDQGGAFELVEAEDGYAICQKITPQIIPTNWRFRSTPQPLTCFGDDRWRSYSMEAEIKLCSTDPTNYAGIGVRYNSAVTCEFTSMCGYSGLLYGDGSWKLMDMENVAVEGILSGICVTEWNTLKLMVLGSSIFFFVNGNFLTRYAPQSIVNSGRVSLSSDYAWNMFRNIRIDPVPVQPLYVRRVDCFGDGILYNENWEIHAMESYQFYNRTSMEAKDGAEFSCQFEGTGIAVIGTAENAIFTVQVDGNTVYENLRTPSSTYRQACFTIDQLPDGAHNMRVFVISGSFKLDVLEIPESYTRMTDTLSIPNAIRNAAIASRRQGAAVPAAAKSMDAAEMLWHMEHPFTEAPEPGNEPERGDVSTESAEPEHAAAEALTKSTEAAPEASQETEPVKSISVELSVSEEIAEAVQKLKKLEHTETEPVTKMSDFVASELREDMAEYEGIDDESNMAVLLNQIRSEETSGDNDVQMELSGDDFTQLLNSAGSEDSDASEVPQEG